MLCVYSLAYGKMSQVNKLLRRFPMQLLLIFLNNVGGVLRPRSANPLQSLETILSVRDFLGTRMQVSELCPLWEESKLSLDFRLSIVQLIYSAWKSRWSRRWLKVDTEPPKRRMIGSHKLPLKTFQKSKQTRHVKFSNKMYVILKTKDYSVSDFCI